jgi:two-component system, LuxR family, sensor kinase FixL
MSWVTVIWSMIASVSFTLATIYLLIWFRERRSWAYLCFFVLAVGVIGMATSEMAAMYAKSPAEYGTAVRWGHFAFGFVVLGSLGFVHFYFGTGKRWLLGSALGLRLLAVVMNFSTGLNLHIRAIQSLQQVNFLGEPVSMLGVWTLNPWVRLGQFAALVQFVYVVDASLRLWRTGAHESRRRAVIVGGTLAFFILFASGQAGLVAAGVLRMPIIVSFPFLAVLLAMSYELSRDVLRAAQMGRELRESEERMTLAAEAAGFGVWMWSIPRNQIWGSERWLRLFGFAPDAFVSFEMVMQRIHPDDRQRVEREVRRALDDRSDYTADYRVVLPDDTQRWVVARGRMHSDTHGKPDRMMGATIDITGRKQAELEIVQQRNELAHVGRVSTMGQLASTLAHELNQPLGAILRNAEAAELFLQGDSPDLEEVRAILADIRKDDQRAGEVIDRMRALLKRRGLEHTTLDIAELVDDVVPLVHPDAVSRRVRLDIEVPRNLPPVRGDRVHLQQVLLNLILNGMDAMGEVPAEARRLTVRARQADAGTIEVAVADAGHGVPAEKFARLFEPFFTTKPNGMGLGLPISSTIITAHGGRIWAENSPAGATFYFTVPVTVVSGKGQGASEKI